VSQLPFCHSVQAKRDTESSIINKFWMPACAGMTTLGELFAITTQSLDRAMTQDDAFVIPLLLSFPCE
jgi:hypothetical protein